MAALVATRWPGCPSGPAVHLCYAESDADNLGNTSTALRAAIRIWVFRLPGRITAYNRQIQPLPDTAHQNTQ